MRKHQRSHARNNSRWDLFLLLNIPPQHRGTRFLETIPEEPPDISEHRCHRESECTSPAEVEIGSDHKITRVTRCRRQWEVSLEDLQRVYRSLSNVDLRPQSHTKLNNNVGGGLPPLKRVESRDGRRGSSRSSATKRMTGDVNSKKKEETAKSAQETTKNITELRRISTGKPNGIKDEQWVMMKPTRRKPIDLLKLEGPMELYTTTRSTYDSAAKEIVNEIRKKSTLTGEKGKEPRESMQLVNGVDVEGKVVGFQRASLAPAKQRRPRTSLKTGGECDYSTINRESFKRFIVIDANNNVRVPIETQKFDIPTLDPSLATTNDTTSLPKVQGVDAKREQPLDSSDACAKEYAKNDHTKVKNKDKVRAKRETASKVNASQHDLNMKQQMLPHDASQYARQEISNGVKRTSATDVVETVVETKEAHEVVNKAVSNINTAVVELNEQKQEVNGADNNAIESILSKGIAELNKNESKQSAKSTSNRGRESRKSMAVKGVKSDRSRHLSLPRTRITKHKNDSQLKFVGDMDFVTTSNSSYRDTTPIVGHHYAQVNDKGSRRDLFRASTEIDLFKRRSASGPIFNPTTTYSSQFQDNLHCPAIDLGHSNSDYTFRAEAGGHKFYYTLK